MYETIINRISEILDGIKAIKEVYPYPLEGTPKAFPAVVFYPDTIENVYSTNTENDKKYKFKMWVEVDIAGTNTKEVFTKILPNAVDKILAEFDEKWGYEIDGHRAWLVIDSGIWGFTVEESSRRAYTELTLTFNITNDI